MSPLVLGHSEAVASRLKKCQDVKKAAQGCVPLSKIEIVELTESVLFLKDCVKKLLVYKVLSGADLVVFGVERDFAQEALTARDAEFEGFQLKIRANWDFVRLLKNRLDQ